MSLAGFARRSEPNRAMRRASLLVAATCALTSIGASPLAGQTADMSGWAGRWEGTLINLPLRPGVAAVDVTMEIGPPPATDNSCATWRTTYSEGGAVRMVKDYQLCRGTGATDLYIDEGNDVRLTARWLGDVLVSPFKVGETLLIMTMRLRGDVLVEEILTAIDRPAASGVVPLEPQAIQRLTLRRVEGTGG